MGDQVRCYLLERTDKVRHSLRRFCWTEQAPCPSSRRGYHNAERVIGTLHPMNDRDRTSGDLHPHHDDRWPVHCEACSYMFRDTDPWQRQAKPLYAHPSTGDLLTLDEAQPGAMWWADWYGDDSRSEASKGAGLSGPHLIVRLPGNWDWDIDGPSSNGAGWTRTGEAPNVTARPSIGVPEPRGGGWRYHAFLTDGILVPC